MDRRGFLKASSIIGVGSVVGASALLAACSNEEKLVPLKQPGEFYVPERPDNAIDGKELKVGLVGCGGRGHGAVQDVLAAANNIKVVALGDVFPDKVENVRNHLKKQYNQEVPAENCFVGFDSYKKVIDSGVDMVILTTPPNFRPEHFQWALGKMVHLSFYKATNGSNELVGTLKAHDGVQITVQEGEEDKVFAAADVARVRLYFEF